MTLACGVQSVITAASIAGAAWSWHAARDLDLKAAILLSAPLLASPHVPDDDLMLLGPAIAFYVATGRRSGFRPYEASALAAAWVAPVLARTVAGTSGIPFGWLALVALFARAMRRAIVDQRDVTFHPVAA